ncbi:sodium-translocating pyrophosphatase [Thermomonospora curvata]|uniref:K(+)-insensitive pyrophosphate-energized proton pump n=1 Tax=Thermomonospora curvata (strain ATCC 19995 / DSM 43183 / JCM 3096 / KCTC 9072 / NBRC 15933 / NCIMB 10081 / Henssen B9) TaxID=471852 RepID=D1A7D8_THECD|nr:sodium-translocating pyrophosphatase [Thermomonospora curvata]ACZ00344.1 V-type H(+)-translocating pyrophosphatase [Thermomonospora curvata DSM 43183]
MSGLSLSSPAGGAEIDLGGGDLALVAIVGLVALLALIVAGWLVREVLAAGQGTEKMRNIARAVQIGAGAYLKRQFRTVAIFVVLIPLLLLLLPADDMAVRIGRSVFFVIGALFSAITGFAGMWLAVRGNVRVAAAARDGDAAAERRAMRLAFRTGGVAGMFTVGLGLFGAAVVVLSYQGGAPGVLEGFGFGAALLAMFMRVGGGIFTKAADVGADLVGKVEQGIPEDDPRNPATIADNVGDNVGDCAGMAADLFESYAVTLVAALILGTVAFGTHGLVFPLIVPMIGVITAMIGIFAVAPRARDRSGMTAINRGFFISAIISALLVAVAAYGYLPSSFAELGGVTDPQITALEADPRLVALGAVLIGIVLASAIQLLTGYFTETTRRPVREVTASARTGPATVVLSGISLGLESAVYSALVIGAAVYGAFLLGFGNTTVALFAVAMAGTGLLTTVGVIVSMDTFGPVSDNAQGIAEMSGDVHGEGAKVLERLDAVGNTTKAITKGIAIATAVLAATALFGAYRTTVETALAGASAGVRDALGTYADFSLSIDSPNVLIGLIVGAAVVFLFSGLAIMAVSRAAGRVVIEVREQFRSKPGIMNHTQEPDYDRVVDICTRDSQRELATPGLLAIMTPIAVGFGLGYAPLGAFLGGAIAAGVLMAVFLANSGGAWDNAKKLVEDGKLGGKGSEAHAATVIGDTVGDPFKDTAGPAINPLIKVMNLVSLLIADAIVTYFGNLPLRVGVTVAAVLIVIGAIVWSRNRAVPIGPGGVPPAAGSPEMAAVGASGGTAPTAAPLAAEPPLETPASREPGGTEPAGGPAPKPPSS